MGNQHSLAVYKVAEMAQNMVVEWQLDKQMDDNADMVDDYTNMVVDENCEYDQKIEALEKMAVDQWADVSVLLMVVVVVKQDDVDKMKSN